MENNEINNQVANRALGGGGQGGQALNAGLRAKDDLNKNYISSDNLFNKGMQIQASHKKFWPSGSFAWATINF